MGLFNFFKKSLPTHQDKVNAAYRCFKPELVEMIFPGEQKQAGDIIVSIGNICNLNLNLCDPKKYLNILSLYADVLSNLLISQCSNDKIIEGLLKSKYSELVNKKEIAIRILAFVQLNMCNNEFVIKTEEDLSTIDFLSDIHVNNEQIAKKNNELESNNLDDPEYGLVKSKPIYAQGVKGSYIYLESLKTELGEELTWKRVGTTSCEGINGIIDIYEGFLPSGELYKTLYVNMYASENSTTVPRGFSK